jgi:hypothetical protein
MRAYEPAAVQARVRLLLGWAVVLAIALAGGASARF